MPQSTWQLDAAYEDKHALDPRDYAFEYLRRNRDFVRDTQRLERQLARGALTPRMRSVYAQRWGLRFREVHTRCRAAETPVDDDGSSPSRPAGAAPPEF